MQKNRERRLLVGLFLCLNMEKNKFVFVSGAEKAGNKIVENFETRCCLDWDNKEIITLSFHKAMIELQILKVRFSKKEQLLSNLQNKLTKTFEKEIEQ